MALEHELLVAATATQTQILSSLAEQLGLNHLGDCSLNGPQLWVNVTTPSKSWQETIAASFHFIPNLSILFRVRATDDYEGALRTVMRATQLVLTHEQGDVLLLFNSERILVQRLKGVLTLNADYGNWKEGFRLLDEIHTPHELRSLSSPL